MKVFCIAAGLAVAMTPLAANASRLTYDKPRMNACHEAAQMGRIDSFAIMGCDLALNYEMLTMEERSATLVNRGILRILAGDIGRARQDFDAALIVNPAQAEAWLGRGIVEWRAGNSGAVIEPIGRALKLQPSRPALAYYVRGLANEAQGDLKAAYADLMMARQLDPKWREPAMQLERYRVVRR